MKKIIEVFILILLVISPLSLFAEDTVIVEEATVPVETAEDSTEATSKPKYDNMSYDPEKYEYTFGLIPTENLNIGFSSHLYVDSAMLYGYPTIGGTWDMGIKIDTITISAYVRYMHLFKPLGSSSGLLYIGEEMGEVGISFKTQIYKLGRFNVNIGINTGWYQQWLMYRSSNNTYNLVNNGLIIRPEASIGWNWIGWWNMELGIFYQTPLYPVYSGYNGWGLYLKVL